MTSPSKTLRAVTLVLRIALGVVFVYAAWTKLRMPWELFAMSIDSYQVLPLKVVELVARTLPWFETGGGPAVDCRLLAARRRGGHRSAAGGVLRADGAGLRQRNGDQLRLLRNGRPHFVEDAAPRWFDAGRRAGADRSQFPRPAETGAGRRCRGIGTKTKKNTCGKDRRRYERTPVLRAAALRFPVPPAVLAAGASSGATHRFFLTRTSL